MSDKLNFLKGPSSDLPSRNLKTNAFYLTEDTHRLYYAADNNSIHEINIPIWDANGNEFQKVYCSMIPYGTQIKKNSNLQTTPFLKVGNYFCASNVDTATLQNCPTTLAFMMQVYSPISKAIDNETTGTWVYRLRKIIDHKGNEYCQNIYSNGTANNFTYSRWEKIPKDIDTIQFIPGDSTITGAWTGTSNVITNYFDGLTILYRINIAGTSEGTTLNINNLGARPIIRNSSSEVTTHYGVGTILLLTYYSGSWYTADYFKDTKNTAGTTNKTGSKMYLIGAPTQGANPKTYSNNKCYIGTDNRLYSNGEKIVNNADITTIINNRFSKISVKDCGAKGDGTTDDSDAFIAALSQNRMVYVPEGTYKLSKTLTIEENCQLELAQSAVLNFIQTTIPCIIMQKSSFLNGNHATIFVPYTFASNVIQCKTSDDVVDTDFNPAATPPWGKWDPQWKYTRYITNINICKPDYRGFHYLVNKNECAGTALHLSCYEDRVKFMWGVNISGVRVAGAFSYGLYIYNEGSAWNHDARIELFTQACETGAYIENCNNLHLAATIQASTGMQANGTYFPYAKNGIKLVNSHNVDLSSCCVWDWYQYSAEVPPTLYSKDPSTYYQYTHICLIGDCHGLILGDFLEWEMTENLKSLIYTDTPSNFEKMSIVQEPIDKWFKNLNSDPIFFDGFNNRQLITQDDLNLYFKSEVIKNFKDVLQESIDVNGQLYSDTGYKMGKRINGQGVEEDLSGFYYGVTGYIPLNIAERNLQNGDFLTINMFHFHLKNSPHEPDQYIRFVYYDENFNYLVHLNDVNIGTGNSYWHTYEELDDENAQFKIPIHGDTRKAAYVRFVFQRTALGSRPMMAINEPISWAVKGVLDDGIKVKAHNLIGEGTILTENNFNEVSIGRFNETNENLLFSIGNGNDSENRSNAFSVDKEGNCYIDSQIIFPKGETVVIPLEKDDGTNQIRNNYITSNLTLSKDNGIVITGESYTGQINSNGEFVPYIGGKVKLKPGQERRIDYRYLWTDRTAIITSDTILKVVDIEYESDLDTIKNITVSYSPQLLKTLTWQEPADQLDYYYEISSKTTQLTQGLLDIKDIKANSIESLGITSLVIGALAVEAYMIGFTGEIEEGITVNSSLTFTATEETDADGNTTSVKGFINVDGEFGKLESNSSGYVKSGFDFDFIYDLDENDNLIPSKGIITALSPICMPPSMWYSTSTGIGGALDMNNSDIVNANSIYFNDSSNAVAEGLMFPTDDSSGNYDSLRAYGGNLYFTPKYPSNSVAMNLTQNNVLYNGAVYLKADQTVNLSGLVSNQPHGIVLVWCYYDAAEKTAKNQDFVYRFVPKYHVSAVAGCGFWTSDFGAGLCKYAYVHNNKITGNAVNYGSGTRNGITYNNTKYVLRYVIGV